MGDRTYTTVTIQEEYYPLLLHYLSELEKKERADPDNKWSYSKDIEYLTDEREMSGGEVRMVRYEANYGYYEDLTVPLCELRIPYDHCWENGGDYLAGTVLMRFDEDGNSEPTEFADVLVDTVSISSLLYMIEEEEADLERLTKYLKHVQSQYKAYNGQGNLTEIPIRPLSEEEAAIIMKYKLEGRK